MYYASSRAPPSARSFFFPFSLQEREPFPV